MAVASSAELQNWLTDGCFAFYGRPGHYDILAYLDVNKDGVASLESQLPMLFQKEASKVVGFNNTHTVVLVDHLFIERLNQILFEKSRLKSK